MSPGFPVTNRLLFFLLGVLLVAIELFFFPGTMVMAISGIALMLGSLVWAMLDLWPGEPVSLGRHPAASLWPMCWPACARGRPFPGALKFLPKGGPWGRLVLETAVGGEPGRIRPRSHHRWPGRTPAAPRRPGRLAATALFPSGQVDISGGATRRNSTWASPIAAPP
jgi:membrane-bound serine protease (ClpP class)